MAYIPPQKRHLNDFEKPCPPTESLIPQPNRNQYRRSFSYANHSIHKWFPVGLADDTQLPSATRLLPFSPESIAHTIKGKRPLALLLNDDLKTENNEVSGNILNNPWVFVAEKIQQDLIAAFENVKNELEGQKSEELMPNLDVRIGEEVFLGDPSSSLEPHSDETSLRQMKKLFNNRVSPSYFDYILTEVVPKIGLVFEEETELYHVMVSHKTRFDSTITCKCLVSEEYNKLELDKIEFNPTRYLCVDMSCLVKDHDMRLMVNTKGTITLPEDEINEIKSMINSAIIDPNVKGGLRWPLVKESFRDKYTICAVWHTNAKSFKNSSIRLKARDADRFDFRTLNGEVSKEVTLKMTGIISQLLEQRIEVDLVYEMLKDNLQVIWDNFLCHGSSTRKKLAIAEDKEQASPSTQVDPPSIEPIVLSLEETSRGEDQAESGDEVVPLTLVTVTTFDEDLREANPTDELKVSHPIIDVPIKERHFELNVIDLDRAESSNHNDQGSMASVNIEEHEFKYSSPIPDMAPAEYCFQLVENNAYIPDPLRNVIDRLFNLHPETFTYECLRMNDLLMAYRLQGVAAVVAEILNASSSSLEMSIINGHLSSLREIQNDGFNFQWLINRLKYLKEPQMMTYRSCFKKNVEDLKVQQANVKKVITQIEEAAQIVRAAEEALAQAKRVYEAKLNDKAKIESIISSISDYQQEVFSNIASSVGDGFFTTENLWFLLG